MRRALFGQSANAWSSDDAALLGHQEFPKSLDPAKHGDRIVHSQELYQRYSRLHLSNDYDRPTAINGLQQRLLRSMRIWGEFGVFYQSEKEGLLPRTLLWHRGSNVARLRAIRFPDDNEVVPSWSWIRLSGGIDYLSLPFRGIDRHPILSTWSPSGNVAATNELVAEAREFDYPATQTPGCRIILDIPEDSQKLKTMAIVLGTDKDHDMLKIKKHYILVVVSKDTVNSKGHIVCKRIGAGYLTEQYLTGIAQTCSLV
jgi:hypothetical protein